MSVVVGFVWTPRQASDAEREAGLRQLASEWDPGHRPEQWQLLTGWVHSSLSFEQSEELFGEYRAALALAADLRDCLVSWSDVEPELRCEDRQGRAAERMDDEARERMHELMTGLGE